MLVAMISGAAVFADMEVRDLGDDDKYIRVGLIQPAIEASDWADAMDGSRVEQLALLSDRLIANTPQGVVPASDGRPGQLDLLIWPEASLPVFLEADRQARLYDRLSIWSRDRNVALLSGAISTRGTSSAFYKTAMLFDAEQTPQEYAKSHIVPLTEHIPFVGESPALDAMHIPAASGARLGRGDQSGVLRAASFTAGTAIGSESLHGDFVRTSVADGADVLVSLAQNGWWSYSPNALQHLNLTRLRSIETRRAVVVSTVSGTSGIVYPDGTVERVAEWMEEDIAEREIPLREDETLYVQHGDWPGRFSLFPAGGLLLLLAISATFYRKPA